MSQSTEVFPDEELQAVVLEANQIGAKLNDFLCAMDNPRAVSVMLGLRFLLMKLEMEDETQTLIAKVLAESATKPPREKKP